MILQPPKSTFNQSPDDIKSMATAVAAGLRKAGQSEAPASTAAGGGSRQRGLPEELRQRVIAVRTALYQRGIYDAVLARFDSSTVPEATTLAIADELAKVAETI